jgi:hypothetical protein
MFSILVPPPRPPSSLMYVHRSIGYGHPTWKFLTKSVRQTYPSVYESSDSDWSCVSWGVTNLFRLCVWSWLARHPAKIEITGSSGGSSPHTKIFFFLQKSWFFSIFNQFFHACCDETYARGRPEAPNSYSLTSWPELIVVIHGEYIPPGPHAVNRYEGHGARTPGSTRHRLELQWYHFSEVDTQDWESTRSLTAPPFVPQGPR